MRIFERYMYAGAVSRDPGAVAAMFTEDGVYEAPLVPTATGAPSRLADHLAEAGRVCWPACSRRPGSGPPTGACTPLWDVLRQAVPEIELPAEPRMRGNIRYRLHRRVIEIRDPQLVLRPYAKTEAAWPRLGRLAFAGYADGARPQRGCSGDSSLMPGQLTIR
jgi:hypothetical protein